VAAIRLSSPTSPGSSSPGPSVARRCSVRRARVSVSKSGVRTSGVLNFDVRYARALNLDVVCTPDKLFWTYAGRAHITNCMK